VLVTGGRLDAATRRAPGGPLDGRARHGPIDRGERFPLKSTMKPSGRGKRDLRLWAPGLRGGSTSRLHNRGPGSLERGRLFMAGTAGAHMSRRTWSWTWPRSGAMPQRDVV